MSHDTRSSNAEIPRLCSRIRHSQHHRDNGRIDGRRRPKILPDPRRKEKSRLAADFPAFQEPPKRFLFSLFHRRNFARAPPRPRKTGLVGSRPGSRWKMAERQRRTGHRARPRGKCTGKVHIRSAARAPPRCVRAIARAPKVEGPSRASVISNRVAGDGYILLNLPRTVSFSPR